MDSEFRPGRQKVKYHETFGFRIESRCILSRSGLSYVRSLALFLYILSLPHFGPIAGNGLVSILKKELCIQISLNAMQIDRQYTEVDACRLGKML